MAEGATAIGTSCMFPARAQLQVIATRDERNVEPLYAFIQNKSSE
jgi:hypothetical protein